MPGPSKREKLVSFFVAFRAEEALKDAKNSTSYHGTDSPKAFKSLNGPAWLTTDRPTAEQWAGWSESGGGGRRRVLAFSLKQDIRLLDTRSITQWKAAGLAIMDDDDPCMWTFARNVALAGFDGWLGLREVMISKPRTSLKYEGTRLIGDQDD